MIIPELLDKATSPMVSYEIIPPKRGGAFSHVMDLIAQLAPFRPPFIDVTSHAAQVSYDQQPDGSLKRSIKRKRPGTIGLCAAIQHRFNIEAVPHLLCNGFTREETEDALIELHYLGIHNVMALRGDECTEDLPMVPDRTRNESAADLVAQISAMNEGRYLEPMLDAMRTEFCVGVAGYPEKHFAAPNLAWDIQQLKRKVDAGAKYVVTQMFFHNEDYHAFVDKCRAAGIHVPIIPGLKILTSHRQLTLLPKSFHIHLPEELTAEAAEAKPEHVAAVGIEWARRQAEALFNAGVPCVHFYIMQTASHVKQVVRPLVA